MIKTKVSIERQINEKQFQFIVPYEASIYESLMMAEDICKHLKEMWDKAQEEAKQQEQQQAGKE